MRFEDHERLVSAMDGEHAGICAAHGRLLSLIAEGDRCEVWQGSGARDMAHWVAMRYGISEWKARRWIDAAHRLPELPHLSAAFASGAIGIDKTVELTRFATPETETRLLRWAGCVSSGAVRRRADRETRRTLADAEDVERSRRLAYWTFDEGRRLGIEAELPAAEGAIVVLAIERLARRVPTMPGEEGELSVERRRADALVLLASGAGAANVPSAADASGATVVVHARIEELVSADGGCEVEGGGVVHAETARRLLCTGRLQAVIEDAAGNPIRIGRSRREPTQAMMRALRHRDGECAFPGCGARRFTDAHHIRWWSGGGRTELDNLVLLCGFHHKLVHELGWRLMRDSEGVVTWFRADGTCYRAGPMRLAGRAPPDVATVL
jgi:Domain of unknown function (DUF222)/HNH endonuclease